MKDKTINFHSIQKNTNLSNAKELCLSLMNADSEDEVIDILSKVGYWDNPRFWRYYGDDENNWSTFENQQSRPEEALVEKIINSIDARLMSECLARGINPESEKAPKSVREAVAIFFEDNPKSCIAGLIKEWRDNKRKSIAETITFAATGAKPEEGGPICYIIADCGEGQTPQMMPSTLLSLKKTNKDRIQFVQGKYNMGGTGAIAFCGRRGLQLILTKRNPNIVNDNNTDATKDYWGFTIVRREDPGRNYKKFIYTYLAPIDVTKPREG